MNFGHDGADIDNEPVVVECYFAASPAKVFAAWTDPKRIVKWFGPAPNSLLSATIDLRPGGTWRFLTSQDAAKSVGYEGEYLDVRPGERLVFTWSRVVTHANGERESTLHAEIEVNFAAKGGGTDLRLIHTVKRPKDLRPSIGDNWRRTFTTLAALFAETADRS